MKETVSDSVNSVLVSGQVLESVPSERIDLVLSHLISLSRSQVQKLIAEGLVCCNQALVTSASQKVHANDVIEYSLSYKPAVLSLKPEPLPLNILYEDEALLVINKSPGMVVHPAPGNYEGTLVNALLFHCQLSQKGQENFRPGIVHRLDKDTSGLMLVAKTNEAHDFLAKQMEPVLSPEILNEDNDLSGILQSQQLTKKATKTYEALVWGTPALKEGVVRTKIGRHLTDRQRMQCFPLTGNKGRIAVSYYKKIKSFLSPNGTVLSLLQFKLLTGRTHQIRVHCQYLKTPMVGDSIYGKNLSKKEKEAFPQAAFFPRQALHSKRIEFVHPLTNTLMIFDSDFPSDIQSLLECCKNVTDV